MNWDKIRHFMVKAGRRFGRFITVHRLTVVLTTGLVVFFGSGLTTYYWANSGGQTETSTMVERQRQSPPDEAEEEAVQEDEEGTRPLNVDDWASFLDYEGERSRMLGIRQSYSTVNVRRGPGMDRQRVATPEGGTLLTPLDRYNDWYRVRLRNGNIGWIHRSLVRQLDVPQPIVEEIRAEYPDLEESTRQLIPNSFFNHNRVKINEDVVNIRQGPGTQFRMIGRSYRYEQLRLYAKDQGWYRVETTDGRMGWILGSLGELVLLEGEDTGETITLPSPQLRLGPSMDLRAQTITGGSIPATVLERSDGWLQVRLSNDQIGWIPEDNS